MQLLLTAELSTAGPEALCKERLPWVATQGYPHPSLFFLTSSPWQPGVTSSKPALTIHCPQVLEPVMKTTVLIS